MSLAASDVSRMWHGDIMSPFPPSGNEVTYVTETFPICRSLQVMSVTTLGVHGKHGLIKMFTSINLELNFHVCKRLPV